MSIDENRFTVNKKKRLELQGTCLLVNMKMNTFNFRW